MPANSKKQLLSEEQFFLFLRNLSDFWFVAILNFLWLAAVWDIPSDLEFYLKANCRFLANLQMAFGAQHFASNMSGNFAGMLK